MQSNVDDVVMGKVTEEDAYALYASTKGHGSSNLWKCVTNSPSLQKSIDAQEATSTSKSAKTIDDSAEVEASEDTYVESILPINQHSSPDEQKVLEVCWNVLCDQLVFSLDGTVETATQVDPTRRNVISLTEQICDSLGFLSPVTLRFKTLMPELCKTKLG